MNKQQLIKEIHKIVGEHCFDKLQVQDGWFNWLWLEKQINELEDQRIAELEKENEEKEDKILDLKSYNSDLKETISKLSFSAVRCQAINDEVCQYILDNELLKKENNELKIENNEFCDYNKKLRKEKQTAVKEFADELNEWAKNIASNSFGAGGSIHYNTFLIKLVEFLKERGIE